MSRMNLAACCDTAHHLYGCLCLLFLITVFVVMQPPQYFGKNANSSMSVFATLTANCGRIFPDVFRIMIEPSPSMNPAIHAHTFGGGFGRSCLTGGRPLGSRLSIRAVCIARRLIGFGAIFHLWRTGRVHHGLAIVLLSNRIEER
jgi:hypothetical protein